MEKTPSTFSFLRGNVLIITVCRVLWTICLSMTWPFFPFYIIALGGSMVEVGLIYAIGGLGGLFLFPVGGFIADHRGRVKLAAIVTYILALTHIFFVIAKDWITLAVGMFIQELFIFYYPALSAITADSLPPSRRGIGFATISAIPQFVGLLATLIGGYLISYVFGVVNAMRIFFVAASAIGLLVATIRLKFLKETLTKSDSSVPLRNIPLLLKTSYKHFFESFKWMSPTLWAIAIITVLLALFVNVAAPFWPVFARELIGLTEYEWGLVTFLVGAIQIPLSIPLGYLVDLYGTRRIILLSMLLAPIPIVLFPFCQTFLQVLPALVSLAIINVLIWPASATLIANVVPRERRGRLLSIIGQAISIGWGGGGLMAIGFLLYIPRILGNFMGGYIYNVNPQYPWFILAFSVLLCFVLSLRFLHEAEEKEV